MTEFAGEGVQCIRGERLVLDGVSFAAAAGDALVLTGPNGSGKSTLLRLMAGLMRSSGGAITWDGVDITDDLGAHNARIVYVGHADAVKPALSVRENVAFWADTTGPRGASIDDAMHAFDIARLADLPARYLSAGQRRRVSLCRTMTSGAVIWLLDEPTTALDAATSKSLADVIAAHRHSGGIAIVSTHADLGLDDHLGLDLGTVT